jgi:VWFA-related protein
MMRRWAWRPPAVAVLVAALAPASASTRAAIVPIDVAVRGAAAADLTQEDFEISIDGRPKPVAAFTRPPAPVSVVLLLDVSASLTNYGDIAEEIGRSFSPALTSVDQARVGGIASRVVLGPRFLPPGRELIAAGRSAARFPAEDRFGPSPIWDALDAAIAALVPASGRRGVVLVTDGRSTGNTIGVADVLERAVTSGVVVQVLSEARPLLIRQSERTFARVQPGLALRRLADQTGGLCLPADPPPSGPLPEPGPLLTQLVQDLRGMYTLGVEADGESGSLHGITVRVKRQGLTVRARNAYRTP